MKKLTNEEFLERSRAIWGDRWDYSLTKYERMAAPVTLICKLHGEFQQHTQAHLKKLVGCSACNGQTPIDLAEFKRRLKLAGRLDEFDYSKTSFGVGGAHQKIKLVCKTHSVEFEVSAWSILQGSKGGCWQCVPSQKLSQDKFEFKVQQTYPLRKYDYSKLDLSGGVKAKVVIGCAEGHGFFEQILDAHLVGKEGCPTCSRNARLITVDELVERSKTIWGDAYDYSKITALPDGAQSEVTFVCKKHGDFVYKIAPHLLGLEGCTACRKAFGPSKGENELSTYVESLGLTVVRNDRAILGGKEIDIYIPKLKVGIEYNGLYYHSEAFVSKEHHAEKYRRAEAAGVRLLQIWEDDWGLRKDVVKSHVAHVLGSTSKKRFFARKASVVTLTANKARSFLEENHIQSFVSSSVYLGLEFGDRLVAVAAFLKSGDDYVLTRYATSSTVVGGHSKLVKYFERTHSYRKLVTFADLTFSVGKLYRATGWEEAGALKPDYSYLYKGERHHKFGFRKDRFKNDELLSYDPAMTESELAELNGIQRVWDAGKIRFEKPHPSSIAVSKPMSE